MHKMFFNRIKNGDATEFGTKLIEIIRVLEISVREEVQDFESPLANTP